MRRILPFVMAVSLLASTASALEVSTDTSKIGATTVSYGGSTFTLWQGYITINLTSNGAPVSGWSARGTALGEQVTSVETTNSTGLAALPLLTDVQPSLIHIQVRSSPSTPWEEPGPPPVVEPIATNPAPQASSAPPAPPGQGGPGGGQAPPAAPPPPAPAAPAAPPGAGLSPGGLFNVFSPSIDWSPPSVVPAAAPEAAPAAAPGGLGLAEAVVLDILMIGGAVGYALVVRIQPRVR